MSDIKVPSDEQIIQILKDRCKELKIQRNEYEQQVIAKNKHLVRMKSQISILMDKLKQHNIPI